MAKQIVEYPRGTGWGKCPEGGARLGLRAGCPEGGCSVEFLRDSCAEETASQSAAVWQETGSTTLTELQRCRWPAPVAGTVVDR